MNNLLNNFINNKVDLKEKNYFVLIIGSSPSKGARSPKLWNNAYNFFKKKIRMFPADLSEKNIKYLIKYLKKNEYFLGCSVTIPYKEKIMKYLDKIDDNAASIGSVNTVINRGGKLTGVNTDYYGYSSTLKKISISKSNKNILILGCGGAGKACIVSSINYFTKSKIFIFNRNKKNLNKFLKKIKTANKKNRIQIVDINEIKKISKLDLIVNCTSIGFDNWIKKNGYYNLKYYSPISIVNYKNIKTKNLEIFRKLNKQSIKINKKQSINFLLNYKKLKIFDIIYQPKNSTLLKIGSSTGHEIINGIYMNLMQAVKAFEIVNMVKNHNQIIKGMKNG